MNSRLKSIIFKKLYSDIGHSELIVDERNSTWFINREVGCWYMEFEESGKLYCRYEFFSRFFSLFSMEPDEFGSIIIDWAEQRLPIKISSFHLIHPPFDSIINDHVKRNIIDKKR
jgi:hypothetical protein